MAEVLGWVCSLILVLTILSQVHKQWRSNSSHGVSRWLFIGQMSASGGFTVYSWIIGNWVFIITNLCMFASAVVGLLILLKHRKMEGD